MEVNWKFYILTLAIPQLSAKKYDSSEIADGVTSTLKMDSKYGLNKKKVNQNLLKFFPANCGYCRSVRHASIKTTSAFIIISSGYTLRMLGQYVLLTTRCAISGWH